MKEDLNIVVFKYKRDFGRFEFQLLIENGSETRRSKVIITEEEAENIIEQFRLKLHNRRSLEYDGVIYYTL